MLEMLRLQEEGIDLLETLLLGVVPLVENDRFVESGPVEDAAVMVVDAPVDNQDGAELPDP